MQKMIIGLIGLNLVLAGYLAYGLTQVAAKNREMQPASSSSLPVDSNLVEAVQLNTLPRAKTISLEKMTWDSLASPDLKLYVANLRRFGCPEQTIQEIMLAEVSRRYSAQERALKVRADDLAPWEEVSARDRRAAESKLRQLLEEKRGLLKELTGVDTGIDMPARLAGRDVPKFESAFSVLPESKRDQVRAIQENYWAQSDDIKQRTMGYLEPEDRDEFVRIKNERREALAKILTTQELLDYELKTSETAPALRSRFDGFKVTDEEFGKIFSYLQPLDEQYSLSRRNPDPVNEEFTQARKQAEKSVLDYIQQVLGDDRYAEYQRTRDPAYRTLSQVGSEAGAAQESILQAYQTQQQIQEEAKRVLQDPNLSQEQRMQTLQEIRAQAELKIHEIFGDKAPQILQRLDGNRQPVPVPVVNPNPASTIPVPTTP